MSAYNTNTSKTKAPDPVRSKIKATFCATCLSRDRRMFSIRGLNLDEFCADIPLSEDEDRVCWECKAIIVHMNEFRHKALKAQALIENMIRRKKCDMFVHSLSELKVSNQTDHIIIGYETDNNPNPSQTEQIQIDVDFPKREVEFTESDNPLSPDVDFLSADPFVDDTGNVAEVAAKTKPLKQNSFIVAEEVSIAKVLHDLNADGGPFRRARGSDSDSDGDGRKAMSRTRKRKCYDDGDDSDTRGLALAGVGSEHSRTRLLRCRVEVRDAANELLCAVCGQWWLTAKELTKHRRAHHTPVSLPLPAETTATGERGELDHTTEPKRFLNEHVRVVHSGAKPFNCDQCDRGFARKSHIVEHIRVHTGAKPYNCDQCDKSFRTKSHLIRHNNIHVHTGAKSFNCDQCDKSFRTKSRLNHHVRVLHTGAKPFNCDQCDRGFAQKSHIVEHIRVHTGAKPFNCDQCYKTFRTKSHLIRHNNIRVHTGVKPFNCDQCDKSFRTKSRLNHHVRVLHTGSKPFNCDQCDRGFAQKSHIVEHIRVHTGAKPFNCDQCDKNFRTKSNLNEHLRGVHTGAKPFYCDQSV